MRMQGLSLETIPPIHIPFRFFLSAPWMGLLAGLALLWSGTGAFSSPWTPTLLGITHLLTLGFMAMVMLGAMFQLVPVISGRLIPGGATVATLVYSCLLVGLLLLSFGFFSTNYSFFMVAMPLLAAAFTIFLLALAWLMMRGIGGGDSIFGMRFAAMSLLIAVLLGLLRAGAYAGLAPLPGMNDTANIHIAWGLGGWTLLLVMAASYQVIPMFHVTPSYPVTLARALPVAVFLSLLALTLVELPVVQGLALACLSASAVIYALTRIYLLNRRKRKIADITARYWRLSMTCLSLAALLTLVTYFKAIRSGVDALQLQLYIGLGILLIYGFAISVIQGMLQKIVPFLCYLHLQRRCLANLQLLKALPHMGNIIPAAHSRWQFHLHLGALILLLAAAVNSLFCWPAALLMSADFAWLAYTLSRAVSVYRKSMMEIETTQSS